MREEKKISVVFALCLGLLGVIFFFRQFYGFNQNDEIYYLSMTCRFVQGDGMLVDEWNNGQLFTFLLLPFMKAALWLLGGTEGLVLLTRVCFLIFQGIVAVVSFLLLRKQGWSAAVCGISFFAFTPFNISAFSYNTLAISFLFLIFSACASGRRWGRKGYMGMGILLAFSVLANPYIFFLYLFYGILCMGNTIARKQKEGHLCFHSFFWVSVGAGIVFVVFVCFVFSRGSLREMIQNLRYIVNDAERQRPFLEKVLKYPERLWRYYGCLLCTAAVCIILRILDRERRLPEMLYTGSMGVIVMLCLVRYGLFWDHVAINFIQVPVSFLGLLVYCMEPGKKSGFFRYWYLPALFFTFLAHMAADTGILAVSSAFWLVSAASIYLLWNVVRDRSILHRMVFWSVCVLQILLTAFLRVDYVWGDNPLPELTVQLTEGPLKGIYTTEENRALYEETLADMEELNFTEDDRLLVVGLAPWIYLASEARVASYTTWEISADDPLLGFYYEKEDRMPDVVYVPESEEISKDLEQYFLQLGYEERKLRKGTAYTF